MMHDWSKPKIYVYCQMLYARKLMLESFLGNDKAVKVQQSVQLRLEAALDKFNNFKAPVAEISD